MSTALVDIRERIRQQMIAIHNTVPTPSGRNISTKGKLFTLPDKRTHPGPLLAVILDWRNFYTYYKAAFNPLVPTSAVCFAVGRDIDALVPSDSVKDKQSENCSGCQWNKFGSAANGGRGKACKNQVRLAVAAPGATFDSEPMILKVSPTGLSRWAELVAAYDVLGRHPIEHVTEISFDPNEPYPTLVFKEGPPIGDDQLGVYWALREKAQVHLNADPISGD